MSRRSDGARIERIMAWYLRIRLYRIIATNFYTPYGEIDIIAKKGDTVIFVEVRSKTQKSVNLYGTPAESVNYRKQQNIIKSARHFIATCRPRAQEYRFDVIEVIRTGGKLKINHIKDAFNNSH